MRSELVAIYEAKHQNEIPSENQEIVDKLRVGIPYPLYVIVDSVLSNGRCM